MVREIGLLSAAHTIWMDRGEQSPGPICRCGRRSTASGLFTTTASTSSRRHPRDGRRSEGREVSISPPVNSTILMMTLPFNTASFQPLSTTNIRNCFGVLL